MKRQLLERHHAAYKLLADSIPDPDGTGGPEASLGFVEGLALIAWYIHPGTYADGQLENVLLRIGQSLDSYVGPMASAPDWRPPESPSKEGRHLLHVATEVFVVGGHTRLLKNWVEADQTSIHSVVLTAHSPSHAVPPWFAEPIAKSGGRLIVLPHDASRLCKAKWLREIAEGSDAVILHHHPSDVVPTVAFAIAGLPPVAILNHADHVFWLGSGVSDMVINLRPAGELISATRRMVTRNTLLPIPLDVGATSWSRIDARERLGISDDQVMILTVGSAYKYNPNSTHNFYTMGKAILDQHPKAQLFMVGVDSEQAQPYVTSGHPRLHCLGIVEDPSAYYAAADLYLEGFPFGSMTALLQAAREGLPVVLPYGLESPVLATDDIAVAEIPRPRDEADYLRQVAVLIEDPDRRATAGDDLRDRVLAFHTGSGWHRILSDIYAQLDETRHQPHSLADGVLSRTSDDLALTKLHATYDYLRYFAFLGRHASEINAGVLARLFVTLPAIRSSPPVYKYYGRWARVLWQRRIASPKSESAT